MIFRQKAAEFCAGSDWLYRNGVFAVGDREAASGKTLRDFAAETISRRWR